MSNDMPEIRAIIDKIQWACHDIIEEDHIKELGSHVQQLIKEAEERQRERCWNSVLNATRDDFSKMDYYHIKQAILNAGGE